MCKKKCFQITLVVEAGKKKIKKYIYYYIKYLFN